MEHDVLSVSMFWAGALMAFAPLLFIGAVLGVWWRQRGRHLDRGASTREGGQGESDRAQAPGSETRPR
jgi:hypothetical protein